MASRETRHHLLALCLALWVFDLCLAAEYDCTSKADGYHADPSDCRNFYRCVAGKTYAYRCTETTQFNVQLEVCDWERNVDCQDGVRPLRDPSASTPQPPTTTTNAPSTMTKSSPEVSCASRPAGDMFRSPTNCSAFYWCVNGQPLFRHCSSGLLFNDATKACDWPFNVDCSIDNADVTTTTTKPTTTIKPTTVRPTNTKPTATSTKAPSTTPISVKTTTKQSQTTVKSTATMTTMTTTTASTTNNTSKSSGCPRRVCYYTNWSQYRPRSGRFVPENIDASLCTHLVYAFAKLDGNRLAAYEWNDESTPWMKGMYERFNALKQVNPDLKTLLAVGGWNMGSDPFTKMVATAESRRQFAEHSVTFLKQHGFDGLDLDWEYPANHGSPAEDRERFILLVKQLRETYDDDGATTGQPPLLLTAAVAAGKGVIDTGYEIPKIASHMDFISLMSYDLHGSWEHFTGHHGALYARPEETGDQQFLNVDWAASYWVQKGCPKEKLVIGIPTYARTFTLLSRSDNSVGDPASGGGTAGTYTRETGFMAYYEVCELQKTAGVQQRWIDSQKVPYLVFGDQWLGYEDLDSVTDKARYARNNGYGGVMMWSLALDDFTGTFCGQGKYPLWTMVNKVCQV